MRIAQILREDNIKSMPHLYLDMDGVQADFFGAWANKHSVEHYKAIADKEKEIDELANSSEKKVYDFFRGLSPLNGGREIVSWLHLNSIPFTVLSAPLRGPYSKASVQAKKDWLDEFVPGTSSQAIFTSAKYKYAKTNGEPNVLVDDFGKYLNAWEGAGGIAVKHEDEFEVPDSGKKTIMTLEKIYKPYLIGKQKG